jgi:prepilin-type N-terminal cleavage/methylation domain-containing protein
MRRSRRRGTTLLEVLIAIFIMGIGLLALLTLFPLGALSIREVINDDRAGKTVGRLSAAVAAYRTQVGSPPGSLSDLTAFLGDDRHADGEDGGYLFQLDGEGTIFAEPAALGKTGVRSFCKKLDAPLEDCTLPEALGQARKIRQAVRENLLSMTAEASAELLLQDPSGLAPRLIRPFLAARSTLDGMGLLDRDGNGLVSLRELTQPVIQHPILDRYYAGARSELALGAGDENIDSIPASRIDAFQGDPGAVFTFDTLRFLVRRYAGETAVRKALNSQLEAAEAAALSDRHDVKAQLLRAFANHVRAQQGKALSTKEAAVLATLAATL